MNRKVFIVSAMMVFVMVLLLIVAPASAGGAMQKSGTGFFDPLVVCTDDVEGPQGQGPDFALIMTGDLEGCHYVFAETFKCTPSGTYVETGTEMYVSEDGESTFRTTYRFTAKYEDCPNLVGEIFGRCQHPIIAGTGTGYFEGVSGRLDFKDDIEAGDFPYRGHLKW